MTSESARDVSEWQRSILDRTNTLFVNLKIPTQPIRKFSELQKSASSMFVGIFETMFKTRIGDIVRKPRVVNDYVNNAQHVVNALAEALSIDLPHITGEGIYSGDIAQIQDLLDIFDKLWNQFYRPAEQAISEIAASDDHHPISATLDTPQGSTTNEPPTSQQHLSQGMSTTKNVNSNEPKKKVKKKKKKRVKTTVAKSSDATKPDLETRRLKRQTGQRQPQHSSIPSAATSTSRRTSNKPVYKNIRKKAPQPPTATSPNTSRNKKPRSSSTPASKKDKPLTLDALDDEDTKQVLDDTATLLEQALGDAAPASRASPTTSSDKHDSEEARKEDLDAKLATIGDQVEVVALRAIASKYPDVYRSMWKTLRRRQTTATTKRASKGAQTNRKSAFAKRIEDDIERYKKSYNLLVKQHNSEMRTRSQKERVKGRLSVKNQKHENKAEQIKTSNLKEELKRHQKSLRAHRSAEEESLMKSLFENAVALEKHRLKAYQDAEKDRLEELEQEQLNKYESREQFFKDRQEMLKEKIQEYNREQNIANQAQRLALRQLSREVEKDYRQKFDGLLNAWDQKEQNQLNANTRKINETFEKLNDRVADVSASQIRALQKIRDPAVLAAKSSVDPDDDHTKSSSRSPMKPTESSIRVTLASTVVEKSTKKP